MNECRGTLTSISPTPVQTEAFMPHDSCPRGRGMLRDGDVDDTAAAIGERPQDEQQTDLAVGTTKRNAVSELLERATTMSSGDTSRR